MARSKSSHRWLQEHFNDEYVKKAQQQGYRSRAVYKLLEIDERDHLLRPGLTVIDLGAAPGGWSQLAVERIGNKGRVIALDILPMAAMPGVEFVQGDFREQQMLDRLLNLLDGTQAGLVMSDMAPNVTGIDSIDQPRAMYLAELTLGLARKILAPGGNSLVKVFQGSGFDEFHKEVRDSFKQVMVRKAKASRSRNREVYLVGKNYARTELL